MLSNVVNIAPLSRLSVSVVIVNYNAHLILRKVVNLLLCSANVTKVIVVDNASKDNSMDEIERLADSQSRLINTVSYTHLTLPTNREV